MSLAGARPDAPVDGQRALPGYVNYISGSDRTMDHTGIPTFAAARVLGTYPGIDLLYYGTDKQLEYDFIVAPNADTAQIKLRFGGAQPILSADGALHLQAGSKPSASDMSFLKPVIYQQHDGRREPVTGSFVVAMNGEVSFHVGPYDHARELVIDPIVSYASYFGGSGEDEIIGSTLNAANQLYAVGQTFSPSLPSGTGEFQPARNPTKNRHYHDGFVTKFSADGSTVLWMLFWLPGSVLALFGLSRKGARRLNKQLKSLLLLALVVSGFGVAATIAAAPTTAPATATPPRRAPIRFRSPLQALTAPSSRSTPPSPSSKPSRSGAKLVPSPSSDPAFGRKLFCDDQAWTSVPSTVRCPLGLLPKNVSPGELL